MTFADTI